MLKPIESPLSYYLHIAKDEHKKNVDECLKVFTDQANINREENAQTVASYHEEVSKAEQLYKQVKGKKTGKTLSIIGIVLAFILVSVLCFQLQVQESVQTALFLGCIAGLVVALIFTCKAFNKRIREWEDKHFAQCQTADRELEKANAQMQPLNDSFPEKLCLRLMEKTLPCFAFDEFFTQQRLQQLGQYGMAQTIPFDESVLETLSGELHGYPFVYDKRRRHYIGSKTYTGSITIHWTTHERNSKGELTTRHHSQTLTATVSKPYPEYYVTTTLRYGNDGADQLSFSRTYAHAEDQSEKQLERTLKKGEKKLQKLETKALREGDDFTQVENTQFEVLFNATNRSDELEFREMFSMKAQQNMVDLLLHSEGYGDDFEFIKEGKMNIIRSEHSQTRDLCLPASEYRSYDINQAERFFRDKNNEFFQAVYFDFAPLLATPLYQQNIRASQAITDGNYTDYNHEQYANEMAEKLLPTPCDTSCIFKTTLLNRENGMEIVEVRASGYYGEERVDYISKIGGDGRFHNVPVYWVEYIPVERVTRLKIFPVQAGERIPAHAIPLSGAYAYIVE